MSDRVTVSTFAQAREQRRKLTMLTAYDYPTARLLDDAGVDCLLVGDSLGMVILGYDSTIPVTVADMVHHTRAVARGARRALVVADLPFMSYHASPEEAMHNAARLLQEGGARAVKLEGGVQLAPTVRRLVQAGIPVMGHIGLTPQSVHALGGYRVQGRSEAAARRLLADALALADAGAFSIVLELVPQQVAAWVTARCPVPTIGIGAGPDCDGQVLVIHDLLGLYAGDTPRFVKRYAELGAAVGEAVGRYITDVRSGTFPAPEHCFNLSEAAVERLYGDETASEPGGTALAPRPVK